jgi:hypothetical protein
MKLNPQKCTFGVPSLLGYTVSARGIEANPVKVKSILKMGPPREPKDAQKLMGCLASLSSLIDLMTRREGFPHV